jgi:hypothetical protein
LKITEAKGGENMARSMNKDGDGHVNYENISGRKVPRKGGYNEKPFKKATFGTPNLPQTGNGLQGALTGGAKPKRSGRGGRGPTLRGGIGG